MTLGAAALGLAGMVLDGAIRDVAEIRERTFPVYARGVTHRGPYKDGPGAINVFVTVGGMPVQPGDIVVGDQDGIVAMSPEEAPAVIEKARAQHAAEEATNSSDLRRSLGSFLRRCPRSKMPKLSIRQPATDRLSMEEPEHCTSSVSCSSTKLSPVEHPRPSP